MLHQMPPITVTGMRKRAGQLSQGLAITSTGTSVGVDSGLSFCMSCRSVAAILRPGQTWCERCEVVRDVRDVRHGVRDVKL